MHATYTHMHTTHMSTRTHGNMTHTHTACMHTTHMHMYIYAMHTCTQSNPAWETSLQQWVLHPWPQEFSTIPRASALLGEGAR